MYKYVAYNFGIFGDEFCFFDTWEEFEKKATFSLYDGICKLEKLSLEEEKKLREENQHV